MGIITINPTITINCNLLLNIKTSMLNDIANVMKLYQNIIIEKNYYLATKDIFGVVLKYVKIYDFYSKDIVTINIEIYNKNIELVLYFNFLISLNNVVYAYNKWIDFYTGLTKPIIVYNFMAKPEQNKLSYAIISGDYYIQNDILFTINSKTYNGIILKKLCSCSCSCDSESDTFVVALYWNDIICL